MNLAALSYALSGAIMLAYAVAALFFLRFWRKTSDRLFALFSLAFSVLMGERLLLILVDPLHELRPYVFTVRLVAFFLILIAILDKNRKQPPESASTLPEQRNGQRHSAEPRP